MDAIRMLIPPKPVLEDAIGYHGEGRYIGLWWEPAGDEAMVSDGRMTYCTDWWAFLTLTKASEVALMPYKLGNSEEPAEHWLVIDLVERTAMAGDRREAEAFVRGQWPWSGQPAAVRNMTTEELEEAIRELLADVQRVRAAPVNLVQVWNESRAACERLEAWLREHRGRWCVRTCSDAPGDTSEYQVVQVPIDNLAGEPMARWPERFALWSQALQVATLLEISSQPRAQRTTQEMARVTKIGHKARGDDEDHRDH